MSRRWLPDVPSRLRAGLIAALGILACALPFPESPLPETPTLTLEFDGCLYVMGPAAEPVCVLDATDPSLRLWVRSATGAPIEVTAGVDSQDQTQADPIQGGYLFRFTDIDAPEIVVQAAGSRRTLRLKTSQPLPRGLNDWLSEFSEEQDAWLKTGFPEELRASFFEELAWETTGGVQVDALKQAADFYTEEGRISDQLRLLTTAHFILYVVLDSPEEAAKILIELPEVPAGDGRSAFIVAFYRGSWAARTGRFSHAVLELESARDQAERLAMEEEQVLAEQDLAHVWAGLGRYERAQDLLLRLYDRADSDKKADCVHADLLNDIGWTELLLLEAGFDVDPVPALRRASRAAVGCPSEKVWTIEINLALAALARKQPVGAREHLETARGQDPKIWWSWAWQQEAEARLALAEGRYAVAEELFKELRATPEARFNAGLEWRSAVGTARALEGQGRIEDALRAYAEADELAYRAILATPFDESGNGRLYQRETRYHLELLRKLGRNEDALQVARRSLARQIRRLALGSRLRGLEPAQKKAWDLNVGHYWSLMIQVHHLMREEETAAADRAQERRKEQNDLATQAANAFDEALLLLGEANPGLGPEPPPRRSGELLLVYHPSDRGWIGFAADDHGVEVAEIDGLDENPAKWLAPFAAPLGRARKIRVLPYGSLWQVDFHALDFGDRPLLEHAEVVYSLDLPAGEPRTNPPSRAALLVWDPGGNLAHAQAEVTAVEQVLRQSDPPWEVRPLAGAGVDAVRRALEEGPKLFHFAGHGELLSWEAESGLILEQLFDNDVRLSIRDVIALTAVPEIVVLSACESTQPVSLEEPSSLGVGQAFLVSGTRVVVGASEKIGDEEARAAMQLFYRFFADTGSAATALRAVQLAPEASPEWMKLRVVER